MDNIKSKVRSLKRHAGKKSVGQLSPEGLWAQFSRKRKNVVLPEMSAESENEKQPKRNAKQN